MSGAVIEALLTQRPFVAFDLYLPNDDVPRHRVSTSEEAWLAGEGEALCLTTSSGTFLIDVAAIVKVKLNQRLEKRGGSWPF